MVEVSVPFRTYEVDAEMPDLREGDRIRYGDELSVVAHIFDGEVNDGETSFFAYQRHGERQNILLKKVKVGANHLIDPSRTFLRTTFSISDGAPYLRAKEKLEEVRVW